MLDPEFEISADLMIWHLFAKSDVMTKFIK